MKRCIFWFSLLILSGFNLEAQEYKWQAEHFTIPPVATVHAGQIRTDWKPVLQNLEMPAPGGKSWRAHLIELKKERAKKSAPEWQEGTHQPGEGAPLPILGLNFKGNGYNGHAPNDNYCAISNDGILISVINTTIWMYDTRQDSLLKNVSLNAFSDTLGLNGVKFDPKILYDPEADRFIMIFLNGFLDSTTRIIVGFSQTADPTGLWNLYSLNGNPLNNGTWSDYPSIGISGTDLFIGVNTFTNGSVNNSGFTESVFWQISKSDGYQGQALTADYYHGLTLAGKPFFNIAPINGGSGPYGDSMILLSNRNLDTLFNDSIFIFRVTGPAGNATLDIVTCHADVPYSLPPQARQPKGNEFDTNDSRILAGFYENGTVQFTACTLAPTTGYAGIYHGLIKDPFGPAPGCRANILADSALDLGYPNISYSGKDSFDQESIISFNFTSPSVNPGCGAVYFSNEGTYSSILKVQEGTDFVDLVSGAYERWGDYTGSQRKYNEPGVVWMCGSYGRKRNQFPRHISSTWIAELKSPDSLHQHIRVPEPGVTVFPNPFRDMVYFSFSLPADAVVSASVYDIQGRLVKRLVEDFAKSGLNTIGFNTQPLSRGTYILEVRSGESVLLSEKIIKQ